MRPCRSSPCSASWNSETQDTGSKNAHAESIPTFHVSLIWTMFLLPHINHTAAERHRCWNKLLKIINKGAGVEFLKSSSAPAASDKTGCLSNNTDDYYKMLFSSVYWFSSSLVDVWSLLHIVITDWRNAEQTVDHKRWPDVFFKALCKLMLFFEFLVKSFAESKLDTIFKSSIQWFLATWGQQKESLTQHWQRQMLDTDMGQH